MVVLGSIEDQVRRTITTWAVGWYIYSYTFRSKFNYGAEDVVVAVKGNYFITYR
jgi:hypothetical protein